MEISPAARVGMITVLALIIFGITLVWLGQDQRGKIHGVTYHIIFERVEGLTEGAPVRMAGVQIGRVVSLTIMANRKVDVLIDVLPKYMNYPPTKESVYTIGQSFVGERWLEIGPQPGEALPPGGQANGVSPVTMDEILAKSEGTLDTIDESMVGFNKVVNDPEFQRNIKQAVAGLQGLASQFGGAARSANRLINNLNDRMATLTGNANAMMSSITHQVDMVGGDFHGLAGTLNQVVIRSKPQIEGILQNVQGITANLKDTLAIVQKQLANKRFQENIQATVENMRKTTEDLDDLLSDVHMITSDPKVQASIKGTVEDAHATVVQAKEVMEKINHIVGKYSGSDKGGGGGKPQLYDVNVESEWNLKNGEQATNANAWLLPQGLGPIPYGVGVGIDALGRQNLFNFEVGDTSDGLRKRAGVIRSKLGVGMDDFLSNNSTLSLDFYDPTDPQLDLLGRFTLPKDYYFMGGVRDTLHDRNPVIGIGKQF